MQGFVKRVEEKKKEKSFYPERCSFDAAPIQSPIGLATYSLVLVDDIWLIGWTNTPAACM